MKAHRRFSVSRDCVAAGLIAAGLVWAVGLSGGRNAFAQQPADPRADVPQVDFVALQRAVDDLTQTFGDEYPNGPRYQQRLRELKRSWPRLLEGLKRNDADAQEQVAAGLALQREVLLANPLLEFERLLLIRRKETSPKLGLPMNWQGNCSLPRTGYDDEIAVLDSLRSDARLTTLYKPEGGGFVGDMDLHFDGDRLLFSSIGTNGQWQVYEIRTDGTQLRQVTQFEEKDVDSYDACYLPNGKIIVSSTVGLKGVPCVRGSVAVANLFLMDQQGGNVRQLTFDQDHDWCPTVMEDGRVLYLRWEYSDLPHFASRILFQMNPDGTEQRAFYGSNSYWPNSMFYARPVPGRPSKFVAVISGHHDVPRMGELILFDVSQGRHEADGVVQRIPGFGQPVEPILRDALVKESWPKFLHPWPLSDKYFLVSAKPTAQSSWGVYLVDVFDNMTLLKELPSEALLEPIPLRPTRRPPVIPDRVKPDEKTASVYIADIYAGPGLAGVPRGTVKQARLLTYHFAYHGVGGQIDRVGLDGPWDIKQVIGTVPVEPDGSALFRIPANTPISIQPLDREGKALQLMRSWFVGMPGEAISCTGCHERPNAATANHQTIALSKTAAEITPWYGPTRGFSFVREVQPVLDQHCLGCHGGQARSEGKQLADLRLQPSIPLQAAKDSYNAAARFSPSYLELRRFVRSPTIESDMHLLPPGEFHADTTRLVQLLRKGHHGVRLDAQAWDRLITWIDLHAPAHGTWHEIVGDDRIAGQREKRRAMRNRYAGLDEDPEAIYQTSYTAEQEPSPQLHSHPDSSDRSTETVDCPGWPFDSDEARRRQQAEGISRQTIPLRQEVNLDLILIPAGSFVMGDPQGHPDERPIRCVHIERSFWMGQFEVTNAQFALFDPSHDSRLEHGDFLQFSPEERGYPLNNSQQPVVRVSWQEATEFCRWLSAKTGRTFRLPTETEWEYACRAGTQTPLSYGGLDDDFSEFANLADATFKSIDSFDPWHLPIDAIPPWRPADDRFDDGARVSVAVGSFRPNAWDLYDMHGNVAEWTGSTDAGETGDERRIARGGSWYDRPKDSRSSSRLSYRPWQRVYDVGFRVICEVDSEAISKE